ncbi:MAG: TadE family protein [Terriglobales bacterium]
MGHSVTAMKLLRKITGRCISRGAIFRDSRGAEIAEAAIVLPMVFMLLLGIYWFGRAYNTYATITHAAREGARAATAPTAALLGNTALTPDQVATRVSEVLQASKLRPSQVTSLLPNPALRDCTTLAPVVACQPVTAGNPQICFQQNVQINGTSTGPAACGVSVSFQYPYQFYLPFTSLDRQLIMLKADVQIAGEN